MDIKQVRKFVLDTLNKGSEAQNVTIIPREFQEGEENIYKKVRVTSYTLEWMGEEVEKAEEVQEVVGFIILDAWGNLSPMKLPLAAFEIKNAGRKK